MTTNDHDHDPAQRLHGLDALRGGALLLGLVLHATMSFFPVQIWIVQDNDTSPVASGLFFAIHLFRMTTFFLIAGLFARMMLHRRGAWSFIKDRFSRIGGGLFGMWWVVFPAIVAVFIWIAIRANGGVAPTDAPPPPGFSVETFPLTHLWFLWVLLIFYAVMLILRAPFALMDRGGGWGRFVDRITGALIGPWTPAVLAAPVALALYLQPDWIAFFGVPTPDTGLVPNIPALTAFGLSFGLGFLLDRRRDLLVRIERFWPVFTLMALGVGTAAMILAGGPVPDLEPMTDPDEKATMAAVYAFAVFASTFAMIALALRFASGRSAIIRYLADASYWVYIVHLPLVMVGQVLVADIAAPWPLKLLAVVGGTLGVALITYELLVRHTFIGSWLNGRRIPWRRMANMSAE